MHNCLIPKLKLTIKNDTDVTLNLSSNAISDSNDETNFPHKLLITWIIVNYISRLCKAFANNTLCNIKFSKPQLKQKMELT